MKKTINKFIKLFSLGLLLFAVDISYAQSPQKKLFEDAWKFIERRSEDKGAQFRKTYGDNKDALSNVINCGKIRCNLDSRACLQKKSENSQTSFICVQKNDVYIYKKQGYSEVATQAKKAMPKGENCYKARTNDNVNRQTTVYCVEAISDRIEVSAGEDDDTTCGVVEVSWYNNRKCIFCPMIGVIYGVADRMAVIAHNAFSRSFAVVIAVGLLVWIAFKVLAFVSDLSKQDAGKFITELLKQSFKFLIAFFALIYYEQIFDMLIIPLIRSGMTYGTYFVMVEDLGSRFGKEVVDAMTTAAAGDHGALLGLGDKVPSDYIRNIDNKFFDVYTYATIENMAYNVNLQYTLLQTIGSSLICIAFKLVLFMIEANGVGRFGLGFACFIYGFCFLAFGFLLSIAFVFYLLDAVVQLGIVAALLPLLIATWPFKLTSKYTKKGFEMLLNTMFVFMMMGLAVNLSMQLIIVAVEFNFKTSELASDTGAGLELLIKAISDLDTKSLDRRVNVISIGFILFLVANMMALMLLQKVSEFAKDFSGGAPNPGISSELAGMGAKAGMGAAKKVAGGAVNVAKGAGEGLYHGLAKSTESIRNDIKQDTKRYTTAVGNYVRNSKLGKAVANSTVVKKTKQGIKSSINAGKHVINSVSAIKNDVKNKFNNIEIVKNYKNSRDARRESQDHDLG